MGLTRITAQQISNIDYKQSVRAVTVSNITLSGGAPATVDGVSLVAGDRILVTGQSTSSQNGLYYVTVLGVGSNGTWARSGDADATGELDAGMIVMVTEGTLYADTQWKLITNDPITVGSTGLTFTQNYLANSISSGTSNVVVSSSSNVSIAVAGSNVAVYATTGEYVTGLISATGNITGGNISTAGILSTTGNINTVGAVNITSTTGNYNVLNISGTALAPYGTPQTWKFFTNNTALGGNPSWILFPDSSIQTTAYPGTSSALSLAGNVTGGNLLTSGLISATGNIAGGNLSGTNIAGTLTTAAQTNITSVGTLGSLTVTANIAGGNLTTAGQVTATGNVSGGNLNVTGNIVDTGALTIITGSSGNINLAPNGTNMLVTTTTGANIAGTLNATGNANVGNIGATAVVATTLTGTLQTAAQTNITSVGTLGSLSVTGNITGGNILGGANVNATTHTGTTVSVTGNITGGNILGGANVNATTHTGTTVSVTGNITGGNLLINTDAIITGNLTVNGNTTTINSNTITTNDLAITLGNNQNTGTALNGAGIDVGNNSLATWKFNNATTSWQSNIAVMPTANGSLTLGGASNYWGAAYVTTLTASGNANVGNLGATNIVGTLTTAAQTNITSVGTLSSLSVTGNVTGGNINTAGLISATGNATVGNIAATIGTFTTFTSAQGGNVTGTLVATSANAQFINQTNPSGYLTAAGYASVTGNITGGNLLTAGLISASGNITGGNVNTAGLVSATGNITGGNLLTSGNIVDTNALSIITGSSGNVSLAPNGTNVLVVTTTGANITGTLNATGNANVGNLGATRVTATTLTGTLSTAAQTNITSVGTLGSLSVTGNITGGNLSGTSIVGTLTTAAQTNITSVGTLSSLSVTGNITGGNLLTAGNIVDTGALTIITGSSGNVSLAPNGTNVLIATTTGANVTGTLNATGNANVGNLGTAGQISATGTITTGAGTNSTGFAVGNGAVSNVGLGFFPTAGTRGDYAIRDYSTVFTTMYLDAGMGGTGGGEFQFRSSNAFSLLARIDSTGITTANRIYALELNSTQSSGDEGGQLNLAKAATNTTLAGNVVVDIFQNKLRFYENGGTIRGAFIDLTSCNASVGTNLLSSSGGGGTPGGSNTQVQFNDAGVFGGVAGFTFDKITNTLTANIIASTNNGNGTNFKVGDDAWIGDVNTADTMRVTGQQNGANAYIVFGNTNANSLGRAGSGPLTYTGAFSATGNITGSYILGNGSLLSGLSTSSISNGTSNVVVAASGNVTVGVTGTNNIAAFNTSGLTLLGAQSNPKTISRNITIPDSVNAMLIGPITIANSYNLTVPTGSTAYIYL